MRTNISQQQEPPLEKSGKQVAISHCFAWRRARKKEETYN
jgi:hypothetical protein